MQFNSYIFILLFLPLSLLFYFLLNRRSIFAGKLALIFAGAVFYIYAGAAASVCLWVSIVFNYILSYALSRCSRGKRLLLAFAVAVNLAALLYFKYRNFYIETIGRFLTIDAVTKEIILPLGISFFTFQQIAWIVGVYRQPSAHTGIVDYLLYVLYFPKLIMGPITEPAELLSQFNDPSRKHIDFENLACGARVFSYGLFKKAFFADTFAAAAAWGLEHWTSLASNEVMLVVLSYTFQIYFDFSGYSDMATGVSRMLNIDLPMNFNSPYKALSIRDFWKRWHMSLTGFLTKYIYLPLGGNRKGKLRTYINTMIVFTVSGIWHGANWTFILWGILHGFLSVTERIFEKSWKKLSEAFRWLTTFSTTSLLWLLFASENVGQWLNLLRKILAMQFKPFNGLLLEPFSIPGTYILGPSVNKLLFGIYSQNLSGLWMFLFIAAAFIICMIPENNYVTAKKVTPANAVFSAVIFVWGLLCLGGEATFIYSGF